MCVSVAPSALLPLSRLASGILAQCCDDEKRYGASVVPTCTQRLENETAPALAGAVGPRLLTSGDAQMLSPSWECTSSTVACRGYRARDRLHRRAQLAVGGGQHQRSGSDGLAPTPAPPEEKALGQCAAVDDRARIRAQLVRPVPTRDVLGQVGRFRGVTLSHGLTLPRGRHR